MATRNKREVALLQELADLKAGIPFHTHNPRSGKDSFRCTSPYCEDLGAEKPMAGPRGEDPEQYVRENV